MQKPLSQSFRIVVADDEADMREYFEQILPRLGHTVVASAKDGRELVDRCRELQPDLVITDIKMPQLDGIEAATLIYHNRPVPVILVSAHHSQSLIERAEMDHVMAYLVKPIKQQDLAPTIGLAVCRFDQFKTLRKEASDLRQALADRKVIERAKGALMKKDNIDENEAFRRLQAQASEQNRKLVDVAAMLLSGDLHR
ncbi:MAG TPA: response regulator [Gemmataceae bacterium]|nr:response regulator [Gemmataceae bacterium]